MKFNILIFIIVLIINYQNISPSRSRLSLKDNNFKVLYKSVISPLHYISFCLITLTLNTNYLILNNSFSAKLTTKKCIKCYQIKSQKQNLWKVK